MPAYVFANIEVTDPVLYEEYRKGVPATIAQYGGRYVARGGAAEGLEGGYAPQRVVILEFPSVERAKAWWNSPEYRPLRAIRQRASRGDLLLIEGLAS
jgi:uncharacterized protein (DUF1330 family)